MYSSPQHSSVKKSKLNAWAVTGQSGNGKRPTGPVYRQPISCCLPLDGHGWTQPPSPALWPKSGWCQRLIADKLVWLLVGAVDEWCWTWSSTIGLIGSSSTAETSTPQQYLRFRNKINMISSPDKIGKKFII